MPGRRAKEIRFDAHALHRMRQRGVSGEEVEACVAKPDLTRPARAADARRFEKAFSRRRRVAVIAEERDDHIRVITAWWMLR
jgi:hypothetical protein